MKFLQPILLALTGISLIAAFALSFYPVEVTERIGGCYDEPTTRTAPASLIWETIKTHPKPIKGETVCWQPPQQLRIIPIDLYAVTLALGTLTLISKKKL
jgi:hypothetical protein